MGEKRPVAEQGASRSENGAVARLAASKKKRTRKEPEGSFLRVALARPCGPVDQDAGAPLAIASFFCCKNWIKPSMPR